MIESYPQGRLVLVPWVGSGARRQESFVVSIYASPGGKRADGGPVWPSSGS